MNRRGWTAVLFALVLAAYALAGWCAVLAHTDPTEMDTVAYLETAAQIRQTGGILNHIPNLIRGVYTEATQHPLYLLIISPFAEHNIRFFITAKLVSYALGFVFLAVFLAAVKRFFGTGIAAGAAALWIVSAGFMTLVTTVACEGLLGVFFIAFWFALAQGRDDRRWWWAAGLFAGLAFVTKSIGILTIPVFVLSAVWWERRSLRRLAVCKSFWGFFGLFLLTALPLLIRNVVVYGSPLYSDSSGVLWVDRWEQFSYERAAQGRFTLAHYLQNHSIPQILQIFAEGFTRRNFQMIVESLKPLPFWRPIRPEFLSGFYHRTAGWQEVWASGLMVLAALGWWRHRRQAAAVPTLVLWAIFAVFVGWYSKIFPNTPPARLLYPVLILAPVYAAAGLKSMVRFFHGETGRRIAAGALVLVSAGLWVNGRPAAADVRQSFEYPAIFKIEMALANAAARPGDRVLVSQQFAGYLYYFEGQKRVEYLEWPKLDGMQDVLGWIREKKIRFVFVDMATALYNPQVFGGYYRVERPGLLRSLRPMPEPFKLLPRDPRIPPIFDFYTTQ